MTVAGINLRQLHKRVGVLLNDVRKVTDYASLMAGCTLEEILEPVVPLEGGGGRIGPKERNWIGVAMKVSRRCQSNSGFSNTHLDTLIRHSNYFFSDHRTWK